MGEDEAGRPASVNFSAGKLKDKFKNGNYTFYSPEYNRHCPANVHLEVSSECDTQRIGRYQLNTKINPKSKLITKPNFTKISDFNFFPDGPMTASMMDGQVLQARDINSESMSRSGNFKTIEIVENVLLISQKIAHWRISKTSKI